MALSHQETLWHNWPLLGTCWERGVALSPWHIISFSITLVSTSSLWFLRPSCEAQRSFPEVPSWSLVGLISKEDVIIVYLTAHSRPSPGTPTQGSSYRSLSLCHFPRFCLSALLPSTQGQLPPPHWAHCFFLYSPKPVSCANFYHGTRIGSKMGSGQW